MNGNRKRCVESVLARNCKVMEPKEQQRAYLTTFWRLTNQAMQQLNAARINALFHCLGTHLGGS